MSALTTTTAHPHFLLIDVCIVEQGLSICFGISFAACCFGWGVLGSVASPSSAQPTRQGGSVLDPSNAVMLETVARDTHVCSGLNAVLRDSGPAACLNVPVSPNALSGP